MNHLDYSEAYELQEQIQKALTNLYDLEDEFDLEDNQELSQALWYLIQLKKELQIYKKQVA